MMTKRHVAMTTPAPVSLLSGFELSKYALSLRPDCTFVQWGQGLEFVGRLERSSQWWLGDLWILGEAKWGEDAAQYTSRYVNGTIRNAAVVCRRFDVPFRDSYAAALDEDVLNFAHFSCLTKLEPPAARVWLDRAIDNAWSARRLAAEIEGSGGGSKTFRLHAVNMQVNAERLMRKLPADKVRELVNELMKRIGEDE